jgi:aminoglycoside phosphotransferase (APT) family kinase protein
MARAGAGLHGDLHPANVLVAGGRLSGVIDVGDLGIEDPAVDLMSAWMLLPRAARRRWRACAGVDRDTWGRGRGWALSVGLAIVAQAASNPILISIGTRGVEQALADRRAP